MHDTTLAVDQIPGHPEEGIILVDKPAGWSSFDVIRYLRRRLGIRKMGHAGTLDPLATGLLIIAYEKATKRIESFMGATKTYEVVVRFGATSTSYDAHGEVTVGSEEPIEPSRGDFEAALGHFIGDIEQVPPIFSAKHVGGRRAYELARQGVEVVLAPRTVHIEKISVLEWRWPEVRLEVECGKGTYIRSLAHDLGQKLACGGYVKELRRTRIGNFSVRDALVIPEADQKEFKSNIHA